MATPKKYFHDHFVLLLLSIDIFLAFLTVLFVLLNLSAGGHSNGYIVQCRDCSNTQAINKFTPGSVVQLLSFAAFAVVVLVAHTMLSMRTYRIHRQLSITILGLGVLLLVLTIIVSHALLILR